MKQITQTGASTEEAISLALQRLGTTRDQVDVEVLQEAKKGFLGFGSRPAEVRMTVKEIQEEVIASKQEEVEVDKELIDNETESNVHFTQEDTEQQVGEEQIVHSQNEEETMTEIENGRIEQEVVEDPIETAKTYITDIATQMGVEDLTIHSEVDGKQVIFKLESEKAALLIGKRGATLNAMQQLTQLVINKSAKSFMLVKLDVENYRERRQLALEQLAERMADKAVRSGRKVTLEPMPSYERKIIHNALANRVDIETHSEGTEPNRYLVIEHVK